MPCISWEGMVGLSTGTAPVASAMSSASNLTRSSPSIGVLDSGLGGLSIVRALQCSLPSEPILYYADSAFCPYGGRDEAFIRDRTLTVAAELEQRGAKALVIACNTACAAALEDVRGQLPIPVIGLEPAVKPAVAITRSRRIAVFATPRTIGSRRLARLVERYARDVDVELVSAPGWVELVEDGDLASDQALAEVSRLVIPVVERGADVLVLGCTHFPFLTPLIRKAAGSTIDIVDSGEAVARRTRHVLETFSLLESAGAVAPGLTLLTSAADDQQVRARASQMLGPHVAMQF